MLKRAMAALIGVALVAAGAGGSRAAEFRVFPKTTDECTGKIGCYTIWIVGDINKGDEDRFSAMLAEYGVTQAFIGLHSGGGDMDAGLGIARKVLEMKFTTGVGRGSVCASMCAAIWLAGAKRFANRKSLIGFHQVYKQDGQGNTYFSSTGNALMGAYYSKLGLSDRAIVYLTTAPPRGMEWFKFTKAAELGIKVVKVDDDWREVRPPTVSTNTIPGADKPVPDLWFNPKRM